MTSEPSALPVPVDEGDAVEDASERVEAAVAEVEEDAVHEPGKLLRIALMLRGLQEEVRRAGADEAGRTRLRELHEKAVEGIRSVLSGDLRDELAGFALEFGEQTPTESEILLAQAQLIGWLEGLFQGIQAAIANQQFMARAQLEQMRQRGLPAGAPGGPPRDAPGMGQYL